MQSIDLIRDVTDATNPLGKSRKLRALIAALQEGLK